MGTWGPGNFDNDYALDTIEGLQKQMIEEIDAFMRSDRIEAEHVEDTMPCVEILVVLQEHCGGQLPGETTIVRWREKFLRIYDQFIDGLLPSEEFKQQRRKVIVDTFARIEAIAHRHPEWGE